MVRRVERFRPDVIDRGSNFTRKCKVLGLILGSLLSDFSDVSLLYRVSILYTFVLHVLDPGSCSPRLRSLKVLTWVASSVVWIFTTMVRNSGREGIGGYKVGGIDYFLSLFEQRYSPGFGDRMAWSHTQWHF